MQIIVIHQKRYGFFQNEIFQKMRRRHRDVGIGTFCRGTFCNILMIDIHSVEHNNEINDLNVPKQAFLTKLRHFQNLAKM